jgi:uncharacterized protein with HEPN domain
LLLEDILEAITLIETAVAGMKGPTDFEADLIGRSSVYWNFTVIGEAMRRLRLADADMFERIRESHRVVGFRNLVAHGYDVLDHAVTWRIITEKLPLLKSDVQALR